MKTALLFVCAAAVAVSSQASSICTPGPGTWCEQPVNPDAGQYVSTAETTIGTGAVNNIIGGINGLGGADLFAVQISNTSAFSATFMPASGMNVTGDSQATLYLLDSTGGGIEASTNGTTLTGFNAAPGIYYIGITGDGNTPEYTVGSSQFAIFTPFVAGQISGPVAGAGPLTAYSGAGCGASCAGGYNISLTGAQFAATPEPASIALTGSVISLMGLLCRFRRRR